MPDFVEEIPSESFVNLNNLQHVILPDNLKIIESKAFDSCGKLAYIKIPKSVEFLAIDSFYNCENLREIECEESLKNQLASFYKVKDKKELTQKDLEKFINLESIEIPNDVEVEEGMFKDKTIKSIKCNPMILPEINKQHLTSIYINEGISFLLKEMFNDCDFVELITIPLSVEEIENDTFESFINLRIVECHPKWLHLFKDLNMTTYIIPNGIKELKTEMFIETEQIQNLFIPNSVRYIEEGAFMNNKKIIQLECDDKWKNSKYFPFRMEIQEGEKIIRREQFKQWYNLKTLIIPNSIQYVEPLTFSDCINIQELSCHPKYFELFNKENILILALPDEVEEIQKDTLKGFTGLIYLKLPKKIKYIHDDAFDCCPSLKFNNISYNTLVNNIKKKKIEKQLQEEQQEDKENKENKELNKGEKNIQKRKKVDFVIDYPNYHFEDNNNNNKFEKNVKDIVNNDNQDEDIDGEEDEDVEINLNKINQKEEIKERTVDDIGNYDPSNKVYLPYITQIQSNLKLASKGKKMVDYNNGTDLQNLANKLCNICQKISSTSDYKFMPRPVQLLAIIRLAESVLYKDGKGSIGEIKTGEGKSFIVSTLAILLCNYGKSIDITTSNIELASRDQKDQEKNFNLFGITSGVLYSDKEKDYLRGNDSYDIEIENGFDIGVFSRQIVYSTNSNFEFVYLRSLFSCKPLRPFTRKYEVVIVDEVDNMFIDQGTSPAILSSTFNIIHYRDVLFMIYMWRNDSFPLLKKKILGFFPEAGNFNSEEGENTIRKLQEAARKSDKNFIDVEYVVENNEVIIIDSNTGFKKPGSRWNSYIHEMVEIKEEIEPKSHSISYCSVTQNDFFNMYNKIVGVTGTVGTKKDEQDLRDIYGVDLFKCPRHFIREKEVLTLNRPENLEEIFTLVEEEIKEKNDEGRPVLVIMDSISNVNNFCQLTNFNVKTIKGVDPIDDKNAMEVAGNLKSVTIATSAAGRGMDIKLTDDSKKAGGLHVIIPFLMPNQRALEQAAGRSGRQGQPGSASIYVSDDDYFISSKAFDKGEHNLWRIQNIFTEYLHNTFPWLFKGEQEYRLSGLEFPFNCEMDKVLEICAFKISKTDLFNLELNNNKEGEDNIEKKIKFLSDYIMDLVLTSWGYYFDRMNLNKEYCEDFDYCMNEYNKYLECLKKYLPENVNSLFEEFDYIKNLFSLFGWEEALTLFGIIITATAAVIIFPECLPFVIGGAIGTGIDILQKLSNNEKIHWWDLIKEFAVGAALEGGGKLIGLGGKLIGKLKVGEKMVKFFKAGKSTSKLMENVGKIAGKAGEIGKKVGENIGKIEKYIGPNIKPEIKQGIKNAVKDIAKNSCIVPLENALTGFIDGKGYSFDELVGDVKEEIIGGTIDKLLGAAAKHSTKKLKDTFSKNIQKNKPEAYKAIIDYFNDKEHKDFRQKVLKKCNNMAESINKEIIKGTIYDAFINKEDNPIKNVKNSLLQQLTICNDINRLLSEQQILDFSFLENEIFTEKRFSNKNSLKKIIKSSFKEITGHEFIDLNDQFFATLKEKRRRKKIDNMIKSGLEELRKKGK